MAAAFAAALLLLGVSPLSAGPEQEIGASGLAGGAPYTVHFSARISRDTGPGVQVQWDFGDGMMSGDPRVYHTFVEPGMYTVRLTARFPDGSVRTSAVLVLTHHGG